MPGFCPNWWESDAAGCGLAYFWRTHDIIERGIFILLALMLAYTAYAAIRFIRRHYLFRRDLRIIATPKQAIETTSTFIADMYPPLGAIKGIASAAPFLGLAGTCYGMLASFRPMAISRASAVGYLVTLILDATATTLAGILVAVPAVLTHNLIRKHVESIRRELSVTLGLRNSVSPFRRAQALPLKSRFSAVPSYALIAVPFFAIILMVYVTFKLYELPKGLNVRLLPIAALEPNHLRLSEPIVVSIDEAKNHSYSLRMNSKNIAIDDFERTLANTLTSAPERKVYLEAGSGLYWGHVAHIIDVARGLHCDVILLTTTPAPQSTERISRPRH